jgi:hypothetical protein
MVGKSQEELARTGRSVGRKRYVTELACQAAQIGEKLFAENEVNLDKQHAVLLLMIGVNCSLFASKPARYSALRYF